MKLLEIFRFEFAYQARRPWPWLAFAILLVFAFENTRTGVVPVTLPQDFILNSPFTIATVTVFSCMIWLLVASPMAGEAAARDMQAGMYPLTYTAPVSRFEYLGGRYLAALALNALVLLGVQGGLMLGVYAGGVDPAIIGPFRPAAYLAAYGFIALPNAVIATTIQFAVALRSGRSLTSYFGSLLLMFFTIPVPFVLYFALGQPAAAKLMDPIGMIAIMNEMMTEWTIVEKNVRMFTLEGPMLANRLLWLGIAVAVLILVHRKFRFAHRVEAGWWSRVTRRFRAGLVQPDSAPHARVAIAVPSVHQKFGLATRFRQAVSTGWSSFGTIAKSPAGLFLLGIFPFLAILVTVVQSEHWGVAMLPRTGYILAKHLTASITFASDYRIMVPLLIVFFAGELVWRERDARIADTIDAMSVPDWVLFLGKFLGLALVLAALMVVLMLVGMSAQVIMGYSDFEIGLYLGILFGLQLPEYLLFGLLALVLQVVFNQKYVALLASIVAYALIVLSGFLGIHHHLLIYGSGPAWTFTDLRGFGPSLGPWAWFKLYWAAWAVLLAVGARLLWVRGRESSFGSRLRGARLRLTRATIGAAALAVGLVLVLGGFIFYNTNVVNEYITDDELAARRAEYERRFGQYEGIPQPQPTARRLAIEIYPRRGEATVRGDYRLVNRDAAPIDSIHLEPAFYVDTRVSFDRPAREVLHDRELGHSIYALAQPLEPGDSLVLTFEVTFASRGFGNGGAPTAIVENGSYFTSGALPVIGYQPARELWSAADRRKHGLPRQVTLVPPGDIDPNTMAGPPATFEATVGTDEGQVGVAPGELRRRWTENGRSYFHYASDVAIGGTDVFFSADYQVHRERVGNVDVQLFVHPAHAIHLERFLRSVRASLDYYSSQFGLYPYRFLQVVEQPGNFLGMGVDGSGVVTGGEGMFLLDPHGDGFDVIFEVAAHEMGHQWWGMQLKPAFAEGGGVISESLAWHSAMQLVKRVKGKEALRRFMSMMRQPNPWPPINTGLPLLRAMDPWANYRKGPYAMQALSEYVGEGPVNQALRTLVEKKVTSLATTMDLYRELQAVTPDSLQGLLHDLFEVNTTWTFDTRGIVAERGEGRSWDVTLDVTARKAVIDSAGRETVLPMDEWVEIGVFAAAVPGEVLGKPIYLQKHRIRSGDQTITVTVPERPARGGIDPYSLLDWEEGDNIEPIDVRN